MNPLVSVIIPTYGRAEMLSNAIDSILKQTYENIEIIVVNDNSVESIAFEMTNNILEPYRNYKGFYLIADGKNKGGSNARNLGIYKANGEYITFLDDDDWYYDNKIYDQINHIVENKLDVSVCGMDIYTGEKIINDGRSNPVIGSLYEFLINGNCFTPMIMAKKSVLINIKGFEVAPRFQDHILMIKLLGNNYKVECLDKKIFVHNDHQGPRITKESIGKYKVRWLVEESFLFLLSKVEIKSYYLNRYLQSARVQRNTKKYLESLFYCMKSIYYINGINDLYIFSRVLFSLLLNVIRIKNK